MRDELRAIAAEMHQSLANIGMNLRLSGIFSRNEKSRFEIFQKTLFDQRFLSLVRPAGIEPATRSLEGCCSIQLSYGRVGRMLTPQGRRFYT